MLAYILSTCAAPAIPDDVSWETWATGFLSGLLRHTHHFLTVPPQSAVAIETANTDDVSSSSRERSFSFPSTQSASRHVITEKELRAVSWETTLIASVSSETDIPRVTLLLAFFPITRYVPRSSLDKI